MAITFPASPTEGQVHNAAPGYSFVFRGGAWVPAPMKTALPRNLLLNPAMTINQQNTSAVMGVAGTATLVTYPADQWFNDWKYSGLGSYMAYSDRYAFGDGTYVANWNIYMD